MTTQARIVFEFLPSGGIVPSSVLRVLKPLLYEQGGDYVRLFFEIVLVLLLAAWIATEGRQVNRAHRREGGLSLGAYFGDWWHVLDWCSALLFVASVVLRLYLVAHTLEMLDLIGGMQSDTDYINLQPLMFQLQQVHNLNAVNCFLLFVKAFQYLALIPQLHFLFATLSAALVDLAFFSAVFLLVVTGFAMSFYMAFGLHVGGYATVADSLLSLFQLVLGIFDYEELYRANRLLAPLLFVLFTLLVTLVLTNLFVAIVTDAYMLANVETARKKGLGESRNVAVMLRRLFYKKLLRRKDGTEGEGGPGHGGGGGGGGALSQLRANKAAVDPVSLKGVDMEGDNLLDAGELEVMLRQTKLSEHFTVKELMARFDEDGSGVLSGGEIVRMNELLLRKRREVELQLAAQISPRTRAHVRAVFETHANAMPADRSRSGPLGALGTHKLRAAVEEMGHAPSEAQLATLLAEFDFDGSGTLDPLEFTALMSRMLGYRELPAVQMSLLKGVFDYVDVDDKGGITQPELAVVVDKFGLKLNDAQLGEYLAEFDTDGDGQISRVEFCSLMAKLQGLVGITANPNLVTKDLQMTVRKLDGLVAANEQRAQRALAALLKEAQVPCKCSASAAAAAAALRTTSPELGYRGGGGGGACGADEPPSGLSSSRRARGLLPEDEDAAACGRRRGASSRRRSRVPAGGDGGGKSLPGKLQLLKSAATSIMAANAVQRVFGGAQEPPAEELQASSSLLEREADANLGGDDGGGGDASGPPVGPPRTPESLIC